MSVTAERAPWFAAIRALDLTRARTCIYALLLIGGPALAGLVTWDGPFQTPDEAANFDRSVQLSEGRFMPRLGPAGDAAGDTLDLTVQRLGQFYTARFYDRYIEPFGEARVDFAEAWTTPLAGAATFSEFSNTVIYFPLAHAIPAAVTAGLRAAGAPPLAWNYAARAANAGVAIGLYCLSIMIMPDAALFILVFALLPRTLFATASLSPDALLLPVSAVFGSLLGRLARAGQLPTKLYAGLAGCTIVIGVFKIAYVPLVVLPTLVELLAKRRVSAPAILLAASALLAVGIWAAWMAAIKPYVFTIRHDVPVDVYGQLRHLMREPLRSFTIVEHTIALSGRDYLKEMVGGNLGSTLAKVPRPVSVVAWVMLVAAAFVGSAGGASLSVRVGACTRRFALGGVRGSVAAVYAIHGARCGLRRRRPRPLLPAIASNARVAAAEVPIRFCRGHGSQRGRHRCHTGEFGAVGRYDAHPVLDGHDTGCTQLPGIRHIARACRLNQEPP